MTNATFRACRATGPGTTTSGRLFRRRLTLLGALVLAAWSVVGTSAARAQDLVLRLAPETGAQYRYVLEQQQVADIDLGALGKQLVTNDSRMEFALTGLSRADDGTSKLALTFGRVVMKAAQGENVVFSIDTDDAEPVKSAGGGENPAPSDATAAVMKAMLGAELGISFSPRGEILGVEGFEAIWEKLREEVAGDDVKAQQLFAALEEGFSGESIVQQMRTGFPVYPEGAVKEGDEWQDEIQTQNPIMGEVAMLSTYTVGADKTVKGRKCREIDVDTKVEIRGASGMVEQLKQMMGGEMEIEFDDLASSGKMCVDYTTGLPWSSDMDNQMGMTLSVTQGEAAEQMTMHMKLDGTVTLKQEGAGATP